MLINFLDCPSPYNKLGPVFKLIRIVFEYGYIAIPIILIVFGLVDFGGAVVAQDEKKMEGARTTFIKRLIYAVVIFFVISIVSIVMKLVYKATNDENDTNNNWINWLDCLYYDEDNGDNE